MKFRKVLALRGPNLWASVPVLEAWIEQDDPNETRGGDPVAFAKRLRERLSLLGPDEPKRSAGAIVPDDVSPMQALTRIALELQGLTGSSVSFGQTIETAREGPGRVIVEYREEALGRACLDAARRDLVLAARDDQSFDIASALGKLRDLAEDVCLGTSTSALVEAARKRGIPCDRLGSNSLIQLGQGARQRRIYASRTDRIGTVAESISTDKELTKKLLRAAGVPVPEGRSVASAEDAWRVACALGIPVVVKPRDGDFGDGVCLNLTTREQVVAAFEKAFEISTEVLVERFVSGSYHRVLVVGGRVVAATRRDPAQVVGDGRSTINQLIETVNGDPRRGDEVTSPLRRIYLDPSALEILTEQGFTAESVPPPGTRVLIRRLHLRRTGGTDTDVTDRVHPDVAAQAVTAAEVIGLEVAGLDILARDIGRPLEEQGGVVVEVNSGPGIQMHMEPGEGRPRPVHEAILETVFPEGQDGRIPLVAVIGTSGTTIVSRLIAHLWRETGRTIGLSCGDGIHVDQRRIISGDCTGPKSAHAILIHPSVEAAVLETSREGILTGGLGFDRCTVAVVTDVGDGDPAIPIGNETLVESTVVKVVAPDGAVVLNASDPKVEALAETSPASVIYFAREDRAAVLAGHRRRGGRAVFPRDGLIVLAEGPREELTIPLPILSNPVENVLAAVAAGWALELPLVSILAGLESFSNHGRHSRPQGVLS